MNLYETVFIIRQEISIQEAEKIADGYVKHLEQQESEILKRENWGLLNLAYRIKRNRKGHYFLLNYSARPEILADMRKQMNFDENIIRHMTIRIKEVSSTPSPMMARRDDMYYALEGNLEEKGPNNREGKSPSPNNNPSAVEKDLKGDLKGGLKEEEL